MLQQEIMIGRVRDVCRADGRLRAAMMYGSFAQGEGDNLSDVEFILFFEDGPLETLDRRGWVARISPVDLFFENEHGIGAVIFENLVRGEFHFDRASEMGTVVTESMRDSDWLPSMEDTLILDRTGELTLLLQSVVGPPLERDTPGAAASACDGFVNWTLFGTNLLARGELARALDLLGVVRGRLLQMVRILEGSTVHWFNASKSLETEIPAEPYARYASCTARLDEGELRGAYRAAWVWGRELMAGLAARHGVGPRASLLEKLDRRFSGVFAASETA